ncbi:MAG: metal ABC transporter permease [Gammaproteobacteria bacterium]|nr:metal ABC transporter permease [Gammaproteobacteria bacterium]
MDDFVIRAAAAGIGLALVAGPLGCFVVWRRMAYFGATLSHAALLGVALGLLLKINLQLGVLIVCIGVSVSLVALERQRTLATDTLLGILAHGSLAIGLIVVSFMQAVRVDLLGYLFGDILAVDTDDLLWLYGGGAACLLLLAKIWRPLLAETVHQELARVDGVRIEQVRMTFLLLLSVVVAVGMQVMGVLLVVSMLIIPPAVARKFAVTPERMALLATLVGCVAVLGGLGASMQWDSPAGPSIVAVATVIFVLCVGIPGHERIARRQQH